MIHLNSKNKISAFERNGSSRSAATTVIGKNSTKLTNRVLKIHFVIFSHNCDSLSFLLPAPYVPAQEHASFCTFSSYIGAEKKFQKKFIFNHKKEGVSEGRLFTTRPYF